MTDVAMRADPLKDVSLEDTVEKLTFNTEYRR